MLIYAYMVAGWDPWSVAKLWLLRRHDRWRTVPAPSHPLSEGWLLCDEGAAACVLVGSCRQLYCILWSGSVWKGRGCKSWLLPTVVPFSLSLPILHSSLSLSLLLPPPTPLAVRIGWACSSAFPQKPSYHPASTLPTLLPGAQPSHHLRLPSVLAKPLEKNILCSWLALWFHWKMCLLTLLFQESEGQTLIE